MAYDPQRNPSQQVGSRRKAISGSYAQKTISNTAKSLSGLSITLSELCDWVEVQVETNSIRFNRDGSTPTASSGFVATAGMNDLITLSREEAADLQVIRVSADSVINICQFMAY